MSPDPSAEQPNAEQAAYWNEVSGPKWVSRMEQLDAQLASLGQLAVDRVDPRPGERALDVGCGCGQSALQLADRVGSTGRVLGVDLSAPMLARASARAREGGLSQLDFLEADAQVYRFESDFDFVFSRFGVMFFQDPVAAFANLRRALRPGGRLGFVCWDEIAKNPWMGIPMMALAAHIPLPPPPAPGAPGPFSCADPARVRGILAAAGFEHAELAAVETRLRVGGGGDVEQALDFLLSVGPASAALKDASEAQRAAGADAVREAIRPFVEDADVVMDAAVWVCAAQTAG